MIFEFKGIKPVIDPSSFVHPQASVTGDVIIGKNVFIGPGASIRADWGKIIIQDGANIQENCTIHMFPGVTVNIHKGAHLGHGCIVHGATIGVNSMIGMNAVIMDDAKIGDECIIGALTLVKSEMIIPNRKVVVGNPGKIIGWVGETGERLEVKEKEAIDMILNVKYEIDIQNGSISSIKKIYD